MRLRQCWSMAVEETDRDFPDTAVLKIAAFCGVRDVPTLCCISRKWRGTVGENALFADWLHATTASQRTSGPQSTWKIRHQDILSAHESSYFAVNSVRGWAAGLYSATGCSVGRDEVAISALAWGAGSKHTLHFGDPDAQNSHQRIVLSGHVDGSVSLFSAFTHLPNGSVAAGAAAPPPTPASIGLVRLHHGGVTGVTALHPSAFGVEWSPPSPPSALHSLSGGLDARAVLSKWTLGGEEEHQEGVFQVQHSVQHVWEEGAVGSAVNGVSACSAGGGNTLAVLALDSGDLLPLDVATGSTGSRIPAHGRSAYCVQFQPDGGVYGPTLLASGGFDSAARVWDMRLGGPAPIQLALSGCRGGSGVVSGRTGDAAGAHGAGARVHAEHAAYGSHKYRVYGVAWSPDGRLLATTGGDGVMRVWDLRKTGRPMHTCTLMKRWADCVAWTGGSRGVVLAGQDQTLRVVSLSHFDNAPTAVTRMSSDRDRLARDSAPAAVKAQGGGAAAEGGGGAAAEQGGTVVDARLPLETASAPEEPIAADTAAEETHVPAPPSDLRAWGGLHAESTATLADAASAARQSSDSAASGDRLPGKALYCGIVDRHAGMVTSLLSDAEDTVVSAATDGTLTLRVLRAFKPAHLRSVMYGDGITATAGVPPKARQWKGGAGGGAFAVPPRVAQRLRASAARNEEHKRFDSLGAYRVPAGTRVRRALACVRDTPETHCVAAGGGLAEHEGGSAAGADDEFVAHRRWTAGAVDAMGAALPRASWQQGGSGAVHRGTSYSMARDSARAAQSAMMQARRK